MIDPATTTGFKIDNDYQMFLPKLNFNLLQ